MQAFHNASEKEEANVSRGARNQASSARPKSKEDVNALVLLHVKVFIPTGW
jgi:hypothetical protein